MSHFSRIATQMIDKKTVLMALKDLGFAYQEGDQQVTGFGGQKTAVEIRIPLKMSYDIGLRKKGPAYEIVGDWFGVRGINQKEFSDKLMQRYAYHATRTKLEEQGFDMIEEKVEETGQIRIVLRRMG
ncbi:MAG: DUF1257 domain-containing protein [Anaerolineaceae bacterium]|nr:DUF1257 domain-containing protein [Anaerolineaceae bacterium]